jgi:hypothetical protein
MHDVPSSGNQSLAAKILDIMTSDRQADLQFHRR